MAHAGAVREGGDIFFLEPREIMNFLSQDAPDVERVLETVASRRSEQERLARYTLPVPEEMTPIPAGEPGDLQGVAGSPGIVEGPARIISSSDGVSTINPGDILCLRVEGRVGWCMFLPIIGGLLYETGNWLCHETNLCRELGIPAVVNLSGWMREIKEGELLRVNGFNGTVTRLEGRDPS